MQRLYPEDSSTSTSTPIHNRMVYFWDNTIPPPGLQPSYNSGSTEPIRKIDAPFDSGGTILSAVSKMVAVGDLGDLQRSRGQLSLLQPSYNSGSTEPIERSLTSFDSAYAISSAVSKLVTVGDLCDLQGSKGHFCLWQPSYNSASAESNRCQAQCLIDRPSGCRVIGWLP